METIIKNYPFASKVPSQGHMATLLNNGKVKAALKETIDETVNNPPLSIPVPATYTQANAPHQHRAAILFVSPTLMIHVTSSDGTLYAQAVNPQTSSFNSYNIDAGGATGFTHIYAHILPNGKILIVGAKANNNSSLDFIWAGVYSVDSIGNLTRVTSQILVNGYVYAPRIISVLSERGVLVMYHANNGSREMRLLCFTVDNDAISTSNGTATYIEAGTFFSYGDGCDVCRIGEDSVLIMGRSEYASGTGVQVSIWRTYVVTINSSTRALTKYAAYNDLIAADSQYVTLMNIGQNRVVAYYADNKGGYFANYVSLMDVANLLNIKVIKTYEVDNPYANSPLPSMYSIGGKGYYRSKLVHQLNTHPEIGRFPVCFPVAIRLSGYRVAFMGQAANTWAGNAGSTTTYMNLAVVVELTGNANGLIFGDPMPMFDASGASPGVHFAITKTPTGQYAYVNTRTTNASGTSVGLFPEKYFDTGMIIGIFDKNSNVILRGIVKLNVAALVNGYEYFAYLPKSSAVPLVPNLIKSAYVGTGVDAKTLLMRDFLGISKPPTV
ncbi:hypothetical protein [Brevibacillus sp. 1238]|uniref:hypothetical protein n=1 Tax=Brevibacillus sp. 1238 TaxID=2940565 RepID=UPI002475D0EB|nr:hypothetical protein [Brevibacillus sp. 1238]MDH6351943.1 hypothetical protein [Brevibacillus sp. 1238]